MSHSRAVRFDTFGDPSVLAVTELTPPEPQAGEITVDVRHAGVNFAEVMFRRGQFPMDLPHFPGLEAVGTVRSADADVTGFTVGEDVAALPLDGDGNADVVAAPAEHTVPLTGRLDGIDRAAAAGAPCNVTTALGVLTSADHLAAGETVVVLAAAGGVGTAAAELARVPGASTVIGSTSSTRKAQYALPFGTTASSPTSSWPTRSPSATRAGAPTSSWTRSAARTAPR